MGDFFSTSVTVAPTCSRRPTDSRASSPHVVVEALAVAVEQQAHQPDAEPQRQHHATAQRDYRDCAHAGIAQHVPAIDRDAGEAHDQNSAGDPETAAGGTGFLVCGSHQTFGMTVASLPPIRTGEIVLARPVVSSVSMKIAHSVPSPSATCMRSPGSLVTKRAMMPSFFMPMTES